MQRRLVLACEWGPELSEACAGGRARGGAARGGARAQRSKMPGTKTSEGSIMSLRKDAELQAETEYFSGG